MTYRAWLEAELEIQFTVLQEEGLSHIPTYMDWVSQIYKERMFLNRKGI
jgi:hypothetical protein